MRAFAINDLPLAFPAAPGPYVRARAWRSTCLPSVNQMAPNGDAE